ncbi:MAG: hypothetical protein K0R39_4639 [Symbiobacteriaceae bacterium]|jgi:hypothetical protein|nr:hypothetical protein [Symbiobacteriaceae bacterium]
MKSKYLRTLVAALSIGALLVALVTAMPNTTSAANLTGGNYTYVINGEEVTFMFDPVVRKEGLLLPTEVFTQFGIKLEGLNTRNITLSKDDFVTRLTLGANQALVGEQSKVILPAPLRLNGRVFLSAELLKEYGIDFAQDGTMLFMRPLVETMPEVVTWLPSQWDAFFTTRGFTANLKSDAGVFFEGRLALVDTDMANSTNMTGSYGTRARLLSLMETHTLVMIKISNFTNRSGGLQTAGFYLVDDQRRQYDMAQVVDIGQGLLNGKLAPASDRVGLIAFPKVPGTVKSLTLWYDANAAQVGIFPVTK